MVEFNWLDSEKERFCRRAEGMLKENGIDFLSVDRSRFGVREWSPSTKKASVVVVYLTPYPYRMMNAKKRKALKGIEGWECTDRKPSKQEDKPIYMKSRIIIGNVRRSKKDESKIRSKK